MGRRVLQRDHFVDGDTKRSGANDYCDGKRCLLAGRAPNSSRAKQPTPTAATVIIS
ncbi:hypothetical protein I547_3665 [Mycobacterium kansasii 824]|nr:hypothetical protein I547_3665 [Mycobacterium kansasii 824]